MGEQPISGYGWACLCVSTRLPMYDFCMIALRRWGMVYLV